MLGNCNIFLDEMIFKNQVSPILWSWHLLFAQTWNIFVKLLLTTMTLKSENSETVKKNMMLLETQCWSTSLTGARKEVINNLSLQLRMFAFMKNSDIFPTFLTVDEVPPVVFNDCIHSTPHFLLHLCWFIHWNLAFMIHSHLPHPACRPDTTAWLSHDWCGESCELCDNQGATENNNPQSQHLQKTTEQLITGEQSESTLNMVVVCGER